jgi:plasmid maintenance system antidote protein VapI
MIASSDFHPDWISAPGDTIADILHERDLSETEFALRIGSTVEDVMNLIQGRATITIAIARQLEHVLGASVEFWMSRDFQYREDVARLNATHERWLAGIPLGDMIKFGWLNPIPRPTEELAACLRFFKVPNIHVWGEKYGSLQAAFRTSPSFDSQPGAVAAWLRQGEIEAEKIDCMVWNAKLFEESLPRIRSLTREKNPSKFIPELQKYCAKSGVSAVVVRSPAGCRASGAVRFVSPDMAVLQLSFRYLTDDQFWFTFFHEAGHLLLHNQKGFFFEGANLPTTKEEQEANEFAVDILIPPEFRSSLLRLHAEHHEVIRFAMQLGISPGIIVGQLQHLGKIPHNQLNGLKRHYKW